MDHTLALIKRSHQGDKEARDTFVQRKYRTDIQYSEEISGKRGGEGGFVSDRKHRTSESS